VEESQAAEAAQYVSESQLAHEAALRIIESEEPKEEPKEEVKTESTEVTEEAKPETEVSKETEETKQEVKAEIRRLKLKYNGEEKEVEEPEAIELAQKGYDYTQKTMALAKEREELRESSKKQLDTKLKEYDEKLQLAEQAIWHTLAPEIQNVDWNKLAAENPAEWAQRYQHVQNVNAKLAQIQAERQKISQARESELKETFQKQAKEAVEILSKDIPGWSNDLYGKVLKTGMEYGFKAEEVNAITDPRAIKVLHDAMKFRALQSAKPAVEKKVASVPKVSKPGTAEKPDQNADAWKKGMAQLKKTGSTQDALAVAKLLIS